MDGNYKTEITNPAVRELTEKFYNGELDGFVKYVKSHYTVDEAKDYLFNECQHTGTKEMKEFIDAMNKDYNSNIDSTYNTMAGPNDYYSDKSLNEGSTSVTTTATLDTNKFKHENISNNEISKPFYTEEVQRMYMEAGIINIKKRIDNLAEKSVINETAFESYFLTILNLYRPQTNDPEVKETLKRIFKSISRLTKEASEIAREKEDIRHILRDQSKEPYFDEYFKTVFEGYTLDDLLYEHPKSVEEIEQDKPIEMWGYTESEVKEQTNVFEEARKLRELTDSLHSLDKHSNIIPNNSKDSQIEKDCDTEDDKYYDLNDFQKDFLDEYGYVYVDENDKRDNEIYRHDYTVDDVYYREKIEDICDMWAHPDFGDEGERLMISTIKVLKLCIAVNAKKLVNAEIDFSNDVINEDAFKKIKEEVRTEKYLTKDNLLHLKNRDEEVFTKYFERFFEPYTVQDLIDGKVI